MTMHSDVAHLCRLCMTEPKGREMADIFIPDNSSSGSSYPMKIITCFSVEVPTAPTLPLVTCTNTLPFQVTASDQLPKQMCSSCVYQLEKFYIFRKQCRKVDAKYRAFLRKVKSKKIKRLDEMSDDDDEEDEGSEDTNSAFVEDYERGLVQAKLSEQMAVERAKLEEEFQVERESLKQQFYNDNDLMKTRLETERKTVLQKVKKDLTTMMQNWDGAESGDHQVDIIEEPMTTQYTNVYEGEMVELTEEHEIEEMVELAEKIVVPQLSSPPVKKPPSRKVNKSIKVVLLNKKPRKRKSKGELIPREDEETEESDLKMEISAEVVPDVPEEEDFEDVAFVSDGVLLKNGLIHTCNDCDRKFHTRKELFNHSKFHTSSKNICGECGKCFSSGGSLLRHSLIHTDQKPFVCGTCGKAFTQKGSLMRHEAVHISERGEQPHVCKICDRAFPLKQMLDRHEKKAHLEQTMTVLFRCNDCPKVSFVLF